MVDPLDLRIAKDHMPFCLQCVGQLGEFQLPLGGAIEEKMQRLEKFLKLGNYGEGGHSNKHIGSTMDVHNNGWPT